MPASMIDFVEGLVIIMTGPIGFTCQNLRRSRQCVDYILVYLAQHGKQIMTYTVAKACGVLICAVFPPSQGQTPPNS